MTSPKLTSIAEVKKRHYVSLFSGCMGLDLGLEKANFQPVVCNDNDSACVGTIKLNRPTLPLLASSIAELRYDDFKQAAGKELKGIDLVAGGPPCQAFSVFGKRKGIADERGKMIFEYLRVISEIQPKVFLMENVRGLFSMSILPKSQKGKSDDEDPSKFEHGSLLRKLISSFEEIGYRVDCFVVNSVNYGAPQIRERVILIGNKYNLEAKFPEPWYSNRKEDGLPVFRTLADVIGGDFKDPDPDLMNFSPRKLKYLAMVPAGGNWRSLPIKIQKESMGKTWYLKGGRSAYWRKLSFSFPCPTLVTMPNHAGTSMCHPSELRTLTVGEMSTVQEFPKEWKFFGKSTEKCRQIGNAVPVRLGHVAGEVINKLLEDIHSIAKDKPSPISIESKVIHIRPHVRTKSYWKNGQALAGDFCYYEDDESESLKQENPQQPQLIRV